MNSNTDSLPSILAWQDKSGLQSTNWNPVPCFSQEVIFALFLGLWFTEVLQNFLLITWPALATLKDLTGILMYTEDDTHTSMSGIYVMSHLNY